MIVHANILEWAASYDGPLFHALLCDAPYEMEFMGRGWDNSGVAFDPETWRRLARCLHPGAFLFVFAGTINDDLISVAMRQAGLRKYHRGGAWSYGSGFPKAARLDTVIDRRAGVERTKVGTRKHQPKFDAKGFEYRKKDNGYNSKDRETFDVTEPATDMACTWQGHRYGGQMLKPALESILIFQKPYAGDAVSSITATGAGALWVDGGRIGTDDEWQPSTRQPSDSIGTFKTGERTTEQHPAGRWPANLVLCHHPDCEPAGTKRVRGNGNPYHRTTVDSDGKYGAVPNAPASSLPTTAYAAPDDYETIPAWRCHPDCAVRRLGEQSGELQSGGYPAAGHQRTQNAVYGRPNETGPALFGASEGTAARFFYNADFMYERLEDADQVVYEAKASRSEREAGLDPRQVAMLGEAEIEGADAESIGALRDGGRSGRIVRRQFAQDTINDGRETPIDNPYQRGKTTRRNTHPTIKPIALARHLATLLLPPDLYAPRRLLIPFSGAGSEMIGAILAGWEEVVGVELEEDHCRIATARLAYWQQRRHEFLDPSKPIAAALSGAPDGQLDLFGDDL